MRGAVTLMAVERKENRQLKNIAKMIVTMVMVTYSCPELTAAEQNMTLICLYRRQVNTTNPAKHAGVLRRHRTRRLVRFV